MSNKELLAEAQENVPRELGDWANLAVRLRERLAEAEATIQRVREQAAPSDHEPTNRVWHEQTQRIRNSIEGSEHD